MRPVQVFAAIGRLFSELADAFNDGRTWVPRYAAHECGHAVTAWFATKCVAVPLLNIEEGTGLCRTRWQNAGGVTERWETVTHMLGGIAGEFVARGRFNSGSALDDLRSAIALARTIVDADADAVPWPADQIADTGFRVSTVYVETPAPRLAAVLDTAFRRALYLIRSHERGFTDLTRDLARARTLDHAQIESRLGSRTWIILQGITRR